MRAAGSVAGLLARGQACTRQAKPSYLAHRTSSQLAATDNGIAQQVISILNPPSTSKSSSKPNDSDLLPFTQSLLARSDASQTLENLRQGIKDSGYRHEDELPLPLAATLLALNVRLGQTTSGPYRSPPLWRLIQYLRSQMPGSVEPAQLDAIERESLDWIDKSRLYLRLKQCVDKGDHVQLRRIWAENKSLLGKMSPRSAKKDEALARILSACMRCDRKVKDVKFRETIDDIVANAAQPTPTPVLNVLLAHRANLNDAEGEGQDAMSGDAMTPPALKALREIWTEAKEQGAVRDVRSYMIYLEGLGKSGDIDGIQAAWAELADDEGCRQSHDGEQWPPVATFNHMLSCTLLVPKTGPPVALEFFNRAVQTKTPINIVTINTILRHHAHLADTAAMNSLFSLASSLGLKPDIVTYTTLVQGLLRAGKLDTAKTVLNQMHTQGMEPNERMCSLLVADLARTGSQAGLHRAEEMMAEMRRKGMTVSQVTWTSLISGYFRGGWDQDAWSAVDRMKRSGAGLNRVGYNMILKQGRGSWCLRMFERMISERIIPNSDTYVILLLPMVKELRWADADKVVAEMKRQGFRAEKGALARLVRRVQERRSNK